MVKGLKKPVCVHSDDMLLYVFSPSKDDRLYQIQMETFTDRRSCLMNHHVVIAEVFEDDNGYIGFDELPSEGCRGLRQQFHVDPGQFKVVLAGKDSSVKLRAASCVSCEEVIMRVESVHTREVEHVY